MRNKMKTILSVAVTFCLAMTALLGCATNVQAAAYKKTITKTVTIKRGKQCVLMMESKLDADKTVKVKVNVVGKSKANNIQVNMPDNYGSGGFIKGKKKSLSFSTKNDVEKGIHSLYVSNYGSGKVKVKITVTSKTANLKLKSCKIQSAEG